MNAAKLNLDTLEALEGRGFSLAEIRKMSPDRVFDEYCGWVLGDRTWGVQLRSVLDNARSAGTEGDAP